MNDITRAFWPGYHMAGFQPIYFASHITPLRQTCMRNPLTAVGQKERATQNRVVKLFTDTQHPHCLGYAYLGNWEERAENWNIEPALLRIWLKKQGHSEALIGKALLELDKAAQRKGP